MSARLRRVVSIPQWAGHAGLADDGRSIATARQQLARGEGPATTAVDSRHGINLDDHATWARDNAWAAYLQTFQPLERAWRLKLAMRMIGDAIYVTRLYEQFCCSRWRFQMTFERWLKRRQRIRDKDHGRKQRRKTRHAK